jgi:hypothetical protein
LSALANFRRCAAAPSPGLVPLGAAVGKNYRHTHHRRFAAGVGAPDRAPLKLRRDDHYLTHPTALRALLAVEDLPRPPD